MKSTKTKPAKRKLNVRLLRKIQQHILEEPKRFFMSGVVAIGAPGEPFERISYLFSNDLPPVAPSCGTTACLHGWTGLLNGKTPRQVLNLSLGWSERKLGLPHGYGKEHLFYAHKWPNPFAMNYERAKIPRRRAEIASERIEHLIKTGE